MDGRKVGGLAAATGDALETRGLWVVGGVGVGWVAGEASIL